MAAKKDNVLERLQAFVDGLAEYDRMNFQALVSLPNALEIVGRCPDGEYKEMAIAALALKKVLAEAKT